MEMNPEVEWYFAKNQKWQKEVEQLRNIVLNCGLIEELKWGCPCYINEKRNIVLIHHFKEYCALLFFKGALMKDTHGILIQQTENVQSARQIRFSNIEEIARMKKTLQEYIYEAIEIEKTGLKIELKKTKAYAIPNELQTRLSKMPSLKKAFESLTPGRQRAYLLYFSAPKQSKTREARIEKSTKQILSGKGLND